MNHYIFVRPGERIFILTDEVAGDNDHTHVIELKIPLYERDGEELSFDPGKQPLCVAFERLELNECLNLTADGEDLLTAYQQANEREVGTDDSEGKSNTHP